ncbi:hypothetical protein LZ31DRAFT_270607 [Colletotrichum somersetense]|nr:hypothetical protein LZ31DRAFT_270607 [Colletotrichum somersetense]
MHLSCGGLGQSKQLLIIIIIIIIIIIFFFFFFFFFFTTNPKRADGKEDGFLPVASHPKRKGDNGKEEGRPLHDKYVPIHRSLGTYLHYLGCPVGAVICLSAPV